MPSPHRDIKIVLSFQGSCNTKIHPWIVEVLFHKINDADESKEKESNVEAIKPGAEQYLKED
ncbi:hypothetical protein EC957_002372 [Mortierella hygrophila]|uniref:Uncharacterized protein n=1 Tax=Mortierella hygrophila TaxID=979708 RepID=A0A9P6K1L8_9FUNG|nr:hypothetical protein EC957_002372 [Mortierella hygrophila]